MRRGLWGTYWICVLLVALFSAGATAQNRDDGVRRERRIALVIGNADYNEARLRNSVNDARAIAEALRRAGFEVIVKENADRLTMYEAIIAFGDRIKETKGVGLFYFSGHGLQVQGRNFMVPLRARITIERMVETEAIDVNRVLAEMDAAQVRVNIVILDACRDNPYSRSFRSGTKGLAQIDAPRGTLIAYATAPGKVAEDGTGQSSPYTAALVKHLTVPGLPIESVFKRVRVEVLERTGNRQEPWEASSLTGDFFFFAAEPLREETGKEATEGERVAEMVPVPAGDFWMGSDDSDPEAKTEEKPRHRVFLNAYLIDKYEVTNALFERFVKALGRVTEAERAGSSPVYIAMNDGSWQWNSTLVGASWRAPKGPGTDAVASHPVVHISWFEADYYCKWADKRLPTDAEWEKAARGVDGRRYPWGNDWDALAANVNMTARATTPVGSYARGVSPYGAHDMLGNAWEWVSDWFAPNYYSQSPERNPKGPEVGASRVVRGGAWMLTKADARTAARTAVLPSGRSVVMGFRCAKDAPK